MIASSGWQEVPNATQETAIKVSLIETRVVVFRIECFASRPVSHVAHKVLCLSDFLDDCVVGFHEDADYFE